MDKSITTATELLLDDSFCAYCLGTDEQARHYWEVWLQRHPEQQSMFREAVSLFHALNTTDTNMRREWQAFEKRLQEKESTTTAETDTLQLPVVRKSGYRRIILAVAACITGVLIAGGAYWFLMNRQTREARHSLSVNIGFDTLSTRKGEQKRVLLADNSTVILNYNSTLIIPHDFATAPQRRVRLTGEAVFSVKKNAARPFIVQTEQVNTTVLGTVFNVNAYPNNDKTTVTVSQGKVGVATQHHTLKRDSTLLLRNEQAVYDHRHSNLTRQMADAENILEWQRGKLRFRESSLHDIAMVLENKFDTLVRFHQPEIARQMYTASFDAHMSLQEIARVLCTGRNLHYSLRGNTLWFNYR